jgi:hypothetical protein
MRKTYRCPFHCNVAKKSEKNINLLTNFLDRIYRQKGNEERWRREKREEEGGEKERMDLS